MQVIISIFCILFIFSPGIIFSNDLPSQYDLRNVDNMNFVTSVKQQMGGTCWTFGTMAAIEGNLLITNKWAEAGESGEPDLAEYHLDWWNGFNMEMNADLDPSWGDGLEVHYGGDYRVTAAYLSRGDGAVRDIDGQSFDTAPDKHRDDYHYYYVRDIEWYTLGDNFENMDIIKNNIMEHGVMGTCMYVGEFLTEFVQYQPASSPELPNHAVAIIGWDDDKITQASQKGAWLCKNSWSEDWGLEGYFWISYYDKHCARDPEMGAVSFQNVEPMKYDKVYYHDYHGWRDTMTGITEVFNAFTANETGFLTAVSFYTAANNVNYTVKIYDQFNLNELQEELSTQSGSFEYSGFHTIDLDFPVTLELNDDFYLYLELSNGGHPYDRTSEIPVLLGTEFSNTIVKSTAHHAESYYKSNANWIDLYDHHFSDVSWDNTANFCIKGLAVESIDTSNRLPSGNPSSFTLVQNYPNPFNSTTLINYTLPRTTHVKIAIYNLLGEEIKLLIDQVQQDSEHSIRWDGTDNSGKTVTSGIYLYQLQINSEVITKKMTLIR